MANYTAESYESFSFQTLKKASATFPSLSIISDLSRITPSRKGATRTAEVYGGGDGGVRSDEFPTVYGYL